MSMTADALREFDTVRGNEPTPSARSNESVDVPGICDHEPVPNDCTLPPRGEAIPGNQP
jgi:hypothetical protein